MEFTNLPNKDQLQNDPFGFRKKESQSMSDIYAGASSSIPKQGLDDIQTGDTAIDTVNALKPRSIVSDANSKNVKPILSTEAEKLNTVLSSNTFKKPSNSPVNISDSLTSSQTQNSVQNSSTDIFRKPNLSTSRFAATTPGGQGITVTSPDGGLTQQKSINLSGKEGSDFMSTRTGTTPGFIGVSGAGASPQDMSALFGGRGTDYTAMLDSARNNLNRPISQAEIEAYKAGKANAAGMGSLVNGGDLFGNTKQLQDRHTELLNKIGAYENDHPVDARDIHGIVTRNMATQNMRNEANNIYNILAQRDNHIANLMASIHNAQVNADSRKEVASTNADSKMQTAGINADTRLSVADKNNASNQEIAQGKNDTATAIAQGHDATTKSVAQLASDRNDENNYRRSLLEQMKITKEYLKMAEENGDQKMIDSATKRFNRQAMELDEYDSKSGKKSAPKITNFQ